MYRNKHEDIPTLREVREALPEGQHLATVSHLENVRAYAEKLNKRARRLGLDIPEVTVDVVRESFPVQVPVYEDPHGLKGWYLADAVTFTTSGEPPVLPGWEFIGAVDRLYDEETGKDLTVFRMLEGHEVPERVKGTPQWCDHCGTARRRVATYLVKSTDTGEVKQVGSSCLKDFTGHKSADAVATWFGLWAAYLNDLLCGEECWEYDEATARSWYMSQEAYLPWVAWSIRHYGWVSRGAAWDYHKLATADHAAEAQWLSSVGELEEQADLPKEECLPSEADKEKAEAALAWAQNLTDDEVASSDYLYNLRQVASAAVFHLRKHLGLVASIPAAYSRAAEQVARKRLEEKGLRGLDEHFGEVKTRYTLDLTVVSTREVENDFGVSLLVKFVDAEGRTFSWFNTGRSDWEVGEEVKVKATVKAHAEYRGSKETSLSRVARV